MPEINGRTVRRISAYLVEGELDTSPARLAANRDKGFVGSAIYGLGFTFDDREALKGAASSVADMKRLIVNIPRSAERIFPYVGGEEVNNDPRHQHSRYVINFENLSQMEARAGWPELIEIVERLVRPQRATDNREARRTKWWLFGEQQPKRNCSPYLGGGLYG